MTLSVALDPNRTKILAVVEVVHSSEAPSIASNVARRAINHSNVQRVVHPMVVRLVVEAASNVAKKAIKPLSVRKVAVLATVAHRGIETVLNAVKKGTNLLSVLRMTVPALLAREISTMPLAKMIGQMTQIREEIKTGALHQQAAVTRKQRLMTVLVVAALVVVTLVAVGTPSISQLINLTTLEPVTMEVVGVIRLRPPRHRPTLR